MFKFFLKSYNLDSCIFSPTDFAEELLNLLIKFQNVFGFESMLFFISCKNDSLNCFA